MAKVKDMIIEIAEMKLAGRTDKEIVNILNVPDEWIDCKAVKDIIEEWRES